MSKILAADVGATNIRAAVVNASGEIAHDNRTQIDIGDRDITEDDLIDFTPELRAEAVEEVSHYRIGPMFTPPSLYVEGGTRGKTKSCLLRVLAG